MSGAGRGRRVALVGAGHAHLHLIKNCGEFTRRGIDLVLVAEEDFWYSGLATGVLGGRYEAEEDRIDPGYWLSRGGGRWQRGRVERVEAAAKRLILEGGATVDYDAASLDVGSEVPVGRVPGLREHALAVKPVRRLVKLRGELEACAAAGGDERVVVVGGGSSGCEVAGNLAELGGLSGAKLSVTWLVSGERVLPKLSERAASVALRGLQGRGVQVMTGARVVEARENQVILEDGRVVEFRRLVAATGLEAPGWLAESGLPVDEAGAMKVGPTLQCEGFETLLGAGDCVSFCDRFLPKVGVHAVRQAPVLLANLLAIVEGRPLRAYRPQRRCLLIMNLGDGTGLATWGPFHASGRWAMWWKDRLDRSFLDKYRPPG